MQPSTHHHGTPPDLSPAKYTLPSKGLDPMLWLEK